MGKMRESPWPIRQHRPLLLFGLPGICLLVIGIAWGMRVVTIYRTIHTLAIGYAMICALLSTLGSLALFVGIILHSVRALVLSLVQLKGEASHRPQVSSNAFQSVSQYRPLVFLGMPGILLTLAGLALGVQVVNIYSRTHSLSAGYALISMLAFIIGSLSLLAGIILHAVRGLLLELIQARSENRPGTKNHKVGHPHGDAQKVELDGATIQNR